MEQIDIAVLNTLSVLVHAQPQTPPYFLAGGQGAFLVDQRTDLEHVGIVPALFQRGMANVDSYLSPTASKDRENKRNSELE